MLKWMVPARGQSPHHRPSVSRQQETQTQSIATEDPLATINPEALGLPANKSKRKRKPKQEEIYSVSRTNPLFSESEETMAAGPLTRYSVDKHERLSIGDSQWSDPGHSTSSSGYESANNNEDKYRTGAQIKAKRGDKATDGNPASDYRRYLALGRWAVSPRRPSEPTGSEVVGRAAIHHQNPTYVTKIQMTKQSDAGPERPVPAPVWPSETHQTSRCAEDAERKPERLEPLGPTTLVEQNKNYVTKISIAPRGQTPEQETLDSIVTDSLLKWTSYGGGAHHDDDGKRCDFEPVVGPVNRAEADADAVRRLSQSLGKRKAIATVSRALSKSGSETHVGHVSGSSIADRISLMTSNRKSEQEVEVTYQRLDQRYVPRNGDANYAAPSRRGDPSLSGPVPFSYLAGLQYPISSVRGNPDQQQHWTVEEDRLREFHHDPVGGDERGRRESLEHDRQSNSSSRSSGSRRVTFSADTVDNEPSNQSTSSTTVASQEPSSAGSSPTLPRVSPELPLDPHHLPYRYHLAPPALMGANLHAPAERGRLAGYYTYNLKSHSGFHYRQSAPNEAETGKWEHYRDDYSKTLPAVIATSAQSQPDGAGVVKMAAPFTAVQLHPNYAFACQERGPCVDFTLDGGDITLLHRRNVNHKLRRRLCCCLLLLLCFIVLIIVVMGVSLYLSQGEKIFGSA